jgi:hypothetical protein
MASGGFSFHGARQAFFAGGAVNLREHTWSVAGFEYLREAPDLTKHSTWPAADFGYLGDMPDTLSAYGYCLRVGSA